jgi:hypothetical protein
MEDTMKALLSTAGALALIATSAAANPQDQNKVTLNVDVAPYIEILSAGSSNLTVSDVRADSSASGNNNQNDSSKAEFQVAANVKYDVTLDWATFNSEAGYDEDFLQAYYEHTDGSCAIGGAITFDVDNDGQDVAQQSSGTNELSNGRAEWKAVKKANATMAQTYAVGTQASPSFNNCEFGIAEPGTYSLDVNITVSKAGA